MRQAANVIHEAVATGRVPLKPRGEVRMLKKIAEFLTLKWLWNRR